MSAQASPEITGVWECPACHQRDGFVGIDYHGSAGDVECDDCAGAGLDYCDCDTELTQIVTVIAQDGTPEGCELDYSSHEGGGSGAEIGQYTEIRCAVCDALVWCEQPPEDR